MTFGSSSFLRTQESSDFTNGMNKQPAIYILASKRNGTLYIGVTSNLIKRVWQHKNDVIAGFTQQYAVHVLVYYELHDTMENAIQREKQLKKWKRAWKIQLIEGMNPQWNDLWQEIQE
jgi:putative endonuclease